MATKAVRRELITLHQASIDLACSVKSVRRYITLGKLPAYRIAGQKLLRVDRADVDKLIQRIPASAPEPAATKPTAPAVTERLRQRLPA